MGSLAKAVIDAAQRWSDANAEMEYWRTRDPYPQDKWRAAQDERQAALSAMIAAAKQLPPKGQTP